MAGTRRLGLIVNPVAGLGGRVGLKGSDGLAVQQQARALGALPQAGQRARQALERLRALPDLELITYPGEMGEEAARACGFEPVVTGSIRPGQTTAQDTRDAALAMGQLPVDLLLFAGGDGTARDVYTALGTALPVLGIPAGVKIHSAVYATNPVNAGELALSYLRGGRISLREAEVMDLDEEAFRRGNVAARLAGYLKIPYQRRLVQSTKSPSPPGEEADWRAIAQAVVDEMKSGWPYILGPGTTTRAIAARLGLAKTLIGVDVVADGQLLAADANEAQLLALLGERPARIVVTPIGGQGCLFGRGNQPISPAVVRQVGRDHITVVSTLAKIHARAGRTLWVDTGDPEVDHMLCGYWRVITGYREQIVYRVI